MESTSPSAVSVWLKEEGMSQFIESCQAHNINTLQDLYQVVTEGDKVVIAEVFHGDKKKVAKIKAKLANLAKMMQKKSNKPVLSGKKDGEKGEVEDFKGSNLLKFVSSKRFIDVNGTRINENDTKLDRCIQLIDNITSMWKEVEAQGSDIHFFEITNNLCKSALTHMKQAQLDGDLEANHQQFSVLLSVLEEYDKVLYRLTYRRQTVINNVYRRRLLATISATLRNETFTAAQKTRCYEFQDYKKKKSSILDLIHDEKIRLIWSNFNLVDLEVVPWEAFFLSYEKALGTEIDIPSEKILKKLITRSGVNYVSVKQVLDFVDAFGPFQATLQNAKKMWKEPWFFPFCTPLEVDTFLTDQEPGTFLVRFAFEKDTHFAIDYVISPENVHTLAIQCIPGGYVNARKVKKEKRGFLALVGEDDTETAPEEDHPIAPENGDPKIYRSVEAILHDFPKVFQCPLVSDCVAKPWFLGDLMEEEVIDLLEPLPPGTFLLRYDTQAELGTGLICSYKSKNSQTHDIGNVGIQKVPNGYMFVPQNSKQLSRSPFTSNFAKETYAKLDSFIKSHCEALRYNIDPENVPELPVAPIENTSFVSEYTGPEKVNKPTRIDLRPYMCCDTGCTYPSTSGGSKIFCDRFHVKIVGDRTIFALADGCNWGDKSRLASTNAAKGVIDFLSNPSIQDEIKTLVDCKNLLIRGFRKAHEKVIEEYQKQGDLYDCGQTTLLAGMLLPLDSSFVSTEWAVVVVSVGDCKAFFWDEESGTSDITYGNRTNVFDARDSGGRLGPVLEGGYPDLRNLGSYFYPCKPGDIIVVTSDGVYDNLDPEHLGKQPLDLQLPEFKTWDQMPISFATEVKSKFTCYKINQLFMGCKDKNAGDLNFTLVDHCYKTTGNSRAYMELHQNAAEPTPYSQYPGKMDHVTAIVLRTGPMWDLESYKKQLAKTKKKTKGKKIATSKQEERHQSLLGIHPIIVRKFTEGDDDETEQISGPASEEVMNTRSLRASGWTMNTFPFIPSTRTKHQDPLKEFWGIDITRNRITAVLTSATKFGPKAAEATKIVCNSWLNYMMVHHKSLEDTVEVTETCYDAAHAAHKALMKEPEFVSDLQSVSLLGSVCCRLPNLEQGDGSWIFVAVSIGNIKAFSWNFKTAELAAITPENGLMDNRIGAFSEDCGELHNVQVHSHVIVDEMNTAIILLSPGVYNQFAPQYLGKKPKDFNLGNKKWDKVELIKKEQLLNESLKEFLVSINHFQSETFNEMLMKYVNSKTEKRRELFTNSKNSTGKALVENSDYLNYPGFLDHASCLVYQVGSIKKKPKQNLFPRKRAEQPTVGTIPNLKGGTALPTQGSTEYLTPHNPGSPKDDEDTKKKI